MKVLSNNKGMTLIEVLFAITIFTALLGPLAYWIQQGTVKNAVKIAADQMQTVGNAARSYCKDNYATLISSATASSPATVTVATLKTDGYLPSTFNNANPWAQSFVVYVNEPTTNDLRVLVLSTGGRSHNVNQPDFGNKTIPSVAVTMGGAGGFVATGDVPGVAANTVQGSYGGWSLSLSGTGITNPGAGHLAYLVDIDASEIDRDALYRVDVPGQPELNQMFTTLDMNSNQIIMGDADIGGGDTEGVRSVNFENHSESDFSCADHDDNGGTIFYDREEGMYICRMGHKYLISDSGNSTLMNNITIASHNDYIAKPTCGSTDAPTPKIYVSPAMASDGGYGYPMQSLETWAVSSGSTWQVKMRVQTREGYKYPNSTYGRIMVITTCE
jgi:prepilin-type N-terminal cleavage/methylation domain-containing protein